MANRTDFFFPSSDGKTKIHAVKWESDAPRAIFQITHGMTEFIDRYTPFAEYLAEHGFTVVGHDHLGHGDSAHKPEDYGYFADKKGAECLVEDIHRLREKTQKEYPALPYFILGHSMGSYMLRRYLTVHGAGLAGALIMGTGANPAPVCMAGQAVSAGIALFHGWHYRSDFMYKLFFSGSFQKFNCDGAEPKRSWLSRDTQIVETCHKDPRCHFRFTLRAYYDFLGTIRYDGKMKNIRKMPKDVPVFLLSGDDDPVGEFGATVQKVHDWFREAGVKDLTIKMYPGYRHELLRELDKDTVFADILVWCEERI